jgi:hypothetical protein
MLTRESTNMPTQITNPNTQCEPLLATQVCCFPRDSRHSVKFYVFLILIMMTNNYVISLIYKTLVKPYRETLNIYLDIFIHVKIL